MVEQTVQEGLSVLQDRRLEGMQVAAIAAHALKDPDTVSAETITWFSQNEDKFVAYMQSMVDGALGTRPLPEHVARHIILNLNAQANKLNIPFESFAYEMFEEAPAAAMPVAGANTLIKASIQNESKIVPKIDPDLGFELL